ncbi:LOW QUALITY PROTEIN: leucine-rich repeat-containing protein 43 [Sceloporus undulatus]|uniref:LOW QUALITY PROTEIN: leucine-rich repeat-containing protein 43 n=1 Tax=Sceloporus undulatus TaxID=8520 RepID=UPI001C4B0040|nr:LOW QUALITY PROTEIN: leucine-rich repeat-containing protein 43 [Sceloporus undulatus]
MLLHPPPVSPGLGLKQEALWAKPLKTLARESEKPTPPKATKPVSQQPRTHSAGTQGVPLASGKERHGFQAGLLCALNCQGGAMEGLSVSAAFREHLRRLCLNRFPCGIGSWNRSRFPPRKGKTFGSHAYILIKQPFRGGLPPPEEETAETLTEFLRSPGSLWVLPPKCNAADQQLRELAVQFPQIIQDSFIFSYFRSLRIVNKKVTEIDAGLLKFPNLEELVLSTNEISKINSANLPRTLKVLELCGNKMSSLKDLCINSPPGLQHLGLGHNRQLSSPEERYITAKGWPSLVSLDLSYNNFTNLLNLLSKLSNLEKLRILILQGNPLALLPGYRGFTIDSLPKLCILDDVIITPDERHNFLGLATEPEILRRSAKMIVSIGKIRGVPYPIGPEELKSGPESPVITYNYYVTYEFAKGEKRQKETVKVALSHRSQLTPLNLKSLPVIEEDDGQGPSSQEVPVKLPPETGTIHSTPRKPWAETIDCEYKKEHITRDLVTLKAFLLAGTTVAIMEEKIVSWPIIVPPDESQTKKGKGKTEKGKVEKGKAEKEKPEKGEKGKKGKGKEEKGKAKDAGKGGNKKKKKSPSPDLQSDPPILKTLGSGHVKLESLVAGESQVNVVCNFGVLITDSTMRPPPVKEKVSKKGPKKDKKSKTGTETAGAPKTPPPAKGKGKKKDSPEGDRRTLLNQPVPLSVEFQMQHMKWTSTSQVLTKA